jgi:type I restriction enzyme S subunit
VLRAKCLFREIDERSSTGKEDLLSVSHIRGVTKRSETNATMFLAKSNKGHKICRPGDLVINTMWAWMGALAVSPHTGLVSPSYGTYRLIGRNALLTGYAHQLLRTPQYVSEYISRSTGIHSSRLRLYPEQFLRIPVLCPPNEEQVAIVRFLNHATRRIADAIQAKKKLIALLNEQKQGMIHRAVTRSLVPSGSLKPSGLPWLGDIPAHWEVRRLKTLASFVTSGSRGWARYYSDTGPTFLRIGNISTTSVDLKLNRIVHVAPPAAAEGERTRVVHNDLLLSITAQMGAVGIVPPDIGEAYVNQHTALIRLKASTSYPRWVAYCLLSQVGKSQCQLRTNGGTKVGLTLDDVRTLLVLSPPMVEQREIVADIDRRTLGLESAIQAAQREIDLLREYRTRLIAEVATGQLDVREAAVELPVETEGAEVAAEADDDTEDLLEAIADDE